MRRSNTRDVYRARRAFLVFVACISLAGGFLYDAYQQSGHGGDTLGQNTVRDTSVAPDQQRLAVDELQVLEVKGRAPKTGYSRSQFSNDWGQLGGCSVRELILKRDFIESKIDEDGCRVTSGILDDHYTGKQIMFVRGQTTSQAVQIDHVVAVSDAWQKGAQQLSPERRYEFYNDPLNLLAVDGPTNQKKGDGDAATWLPPNKDYRCRYVARQIAVKVKYRLWVTEAEKRAMQQILGTCRAQQLPIIDHE